MPRGTSGVPRRQHVPREDAFMQPTLPPFSRQLMPSLGAALAFAFLRQAKLRLSVLTIRHTKQGNTHTVSAFAGYFRRMLTELRGAAYKQNRGELEGGLE